MCYILKKYERAKIAKRDIIVYKVGDIITKKDGSHIFRSEMQKYLYLPNKLQPKVELKPIFRTIRVGRRKSESEMKKREKLIFKGYHFYTERGSVLPLIFVIPKGTKYYVGKFEGVAEQLIFID